MKLSKLLMCTIKVLKFLPLPTPLLSKVYQEIKCFYSFAQNFLNISAMLQIKVLSYRETHDRYFQGKSNAEFGIVFNSQGRQKCTF